MFILTLADKELKHCSNCKYCTDEFIDTETNKPFMWICYLNKDTDKGIKGECEMFDNYWLIRNINYGEKQ